MRVCYLLVVSLGLEVSHCLVAVFNEEWVFFVGKIRLCFGLIIALSGASIKPK